VCTFGAVARTRCALLQGSINAAGGLLV